MAKNNGENGKYAIINTRSSIDPFLTFSTERLLRKQVWENYYSRGDNEDQYDNKKNIYKILNLRHERVQLLGYENFAEWRLQNRMAKTPKNALNLLETIWPAAVERVAEEVYDMQMIANRDQIKIEPWDYRFYSEKVRKEKYNLNSDELKQYLQLDNLTNAMHYVAGRLFFYEFSPIPSGIVLSFTHVKVWEVTKNSNTLVCGIESIARWKTLVHGHNQRSYSSFDGKKYRLNNSNFVKPRRRPLLVSYNDATTFFTNSVMHYFCIKCSLSFTK